MIAALLVVKGLDVELPLHLRQLVLRLVRLGGVLKVGHLWRYVSDGFASIPCINDDFENFLIDAPRRPTKNVKPSINLSQIALF